MTLDLRKMLQSARTEVASVRITPRLVTVVLAAAALLGIGLLAWLMQAGVSRVGAQPATPLASTGQVDSTPVASPTPAPTATATPVPAPTPIPVVYVVQGGGKAVYLLKDPGFTILAQIPDGAEVALREDTAPVLAGGYTWVAVTWQGMDGWLMDTQVYPAAPGYTLLEGDGLYLYDAPQGAILGWMYPGTACYVRRRDGRWAEVSLVDGRQGWAVLPEQ